MQKLKPTFRWFGPDDSITLSDIKQTGATGIVTALHHIHCGEIWEVSEIIKRKKLITDAGLGWSVIESINIHESIKMGADDKDFWIEKYIQSIKNVASLGLNIICYNFMPVLDWTRTHLDFRLSNQESALRFDATALAAFELFILKREGIENYFSDKVRQNAKVYFDGLKNEEIELLKNTILAGLPGTDEVFTIEEFKLFLKKYAAVDARKLKENLTHFLKKIIPEAEKVGVKMCIHPDDPPFPILGLPRVVCTEQDLWNVINAYPSPNNGITFCTGSLGANPVNDLPKMAKNLAPHIHFLHLRNVKKETDGSFYEASHLSGDHDMAAIMQNVIREQQRRLAAGRNDVEIPMRPDHGHKILDDFSRNTYPGYNLIGRLKGLAELRGLEMGLRKNLNF